MNKKILAPFIYEKAFSRNIGWVSTWEQQILRQKTVAIAGMGGVGGVHLLTLARLGIENFHIADMDYFEVENFNRQVGAFMSTVGEDKAATLKRMALDINPEANIKIFPQGVLDENLEEFLEGADLYVDGLDAFVLDVRRKIFAHCHTNGIPAVTAGPLGWGSAYMIFSPDGMSFEEYFQLEGLPFEKQAVNFLFGLGSAGLHRPYIMDPYQINLSAKKGPSTSPSCQLCAGVAGVQTAKILLNRGRVYAAPWYHQFDPCREKLVRRYLPGGNKNIFQRLKLKLAYKFAKDLSKKAMPFPEIDQSLSELEQILDYARWTPSGDNNQPWHFEILGKDQIQIHMCKLDDFYHVLRDYHAIYLTAGFLLETLRIAATNFGRELEWRVAKNQEEEKISFIIDLPKTERQKDPLINFIMIRSVNRKSYKKAQLSAQDKEALEKTMGENLQIQWFETAQEKKEISRLNGVTTDIRSRIPEIFSKHSTMLDFENDHSPDKIPIRTMNITFFTKKAMQWALKSKGRMGLINLIPYLSFLTQLEVDYVPGINCASHYVVFSKIKTKNMSEYKRQIFLIESGMALQKFWLTATQSGIAMQPSFFTACFYMYGMENKPFSIDKKSLPQARKIARRLHNLLKPSEQEKSQPHDLIFMGRVGYPKSLKAQPRSLRKPLRTL